MRIKNIFLKALLFFLTGFYAFALGGVMSGAKGGLSLVQTEYFDIIFPETCRNTALKIASVCDGYYEKIASQFGYEPCQRFPVSITDQVESPNAFFSMAPYNLIVFYDTEEDYDTEADKDSIEGTFYHELTHAVSLNSKSPAMRKLEMFADFITPAGISLTSFWFEGVAVAFESMEEGGRLNNPFFTQKIAAAKLSAMAGEKKFPSWRDVTGARDVYPYGNDAYVFGSCFARYLIETYGMEKYSEFWRNAGTSTSLSFCAGVFKKTYKIKLSKAWKDFYESIKVPELDIEKRNEFMLKDSLLSKKNSAVKSVDTFCGADGRTSVAWYDSLSSAVYMNGKRLFDASGIQKIRFSKDGKSLYVNRLVDKSNIKVSDFVYEIDSGAKTDIEHDRLNFEKAGHLVQKKDGLEWSFLYEGSDGKRKAEWKLGDIIIRNIHFESRTEAIETYVFTWAKLRTDTFARIGKITVDTGALSADIQLQKYDNPCGLIEACPYKNGYLVISEEYSANPLRYLDGSKIEWEKYTACKSYGSQIENALEDVPLQNDSATEADREFAVKKYNPLVYFAKGAWFPLGSVGIYDHDFSQYSAAVLGASFFTSTPWTDKITSLSAGLDYMTESGGAQLSISGGDDSLSYTALSSLLFDREGFKSVYFNASLSKTLWRGLYSSFSSGVFAVTLYGKEDTESKAELIDRARGETREISYKREGLSADGRAYLYFSNMHKFSPGYGQYIGLYFEPFIDAERTSLDYNCDAYGKIYDEDKMYMNAGFVSGARIPFLFPISFSASLFPAKGKFVRGTAQIQLCDIEIQKGIPAVSIYAYRTAVSAIYSGTFKYDERELWDVGRAAEIARDMSWSSYDDFLRLSVETTIGPNTSYFASSDYSMGLCGYIQYGFNGADRKTFKGGIYVNVAWQ